MRFSMIWPIGALIYRETITVTRIAGILICMFGLYLINK